ncbi:hypothetical protein MMC14_003136 [Varicellaria rhodocarpa]|nr:hypothetical protein [Varicellaria rhodocarpa]
MHISTSVLAAILSFTAVTTAYPWAEAEADAYAYDSALEARSAYPEPEYTSEHLLARNLIDLRRDLHHEFQSRDLYLRSALSDLFERDAEADPAHVTWKDPNALKNKPADKAHQTQLASNALDRLGCASGEVCSTGFHKSKDPQDHITVTRPSGKHPDIHVYQDGTASRISNKGKKVNFKRDPEFDFDYYY